ncbi:hypothetical protein QOZ80_9AG0673820 [Eleusine coracana subsp. coracana]|nr:hypothetical protein QOZ80_9AG0673820 [Eleusine coracana subsp. coracana]
MAPSYKCAAMISILLIVFSTAAPNPSLATRSSAEPEAEAAASIKSSSHVVAAPAPAPRGARHSTQLQFFWTPGFPCFPFLPKILLDICHALFPPPPPPSPSPPRAPVVCRPSLAKTFVPACGGFLTNASVSAPSSDCCGKIHSFYDDRTTSPYCLCHVANGEADRMLPAPVANRTRRVDVFVACLNLSADIISGICDKDGRTYSKSIVLLRICISGSSNNIPPDPP